MTDAAHERIAELESLDLHECWAAARAKRDADIKRLAPTLTRRLVASLERRLNAGDSLTRDEHEQWFAAVEIANRASRGRSQRRAMLNGSWYRTPVAELIFPHNRRKPNSRQVRTGALTRRSRRSRRSRAPTSRQDDPEPLAEAVRS